MAETAYIVLRYRQMPGAEPPEGWQQVEEGVNAASAQAAIRGVCSRQKNAEGTYVAVPVRSWSPVAVRAEQQTVLKLEEAAASSATAASEDG